MLKGRHLLGLVACGQCGTSPMRETRRAKPVSRPPLISDHGRTTFQPPRVRLWRSRSLDHRGEGECDASAQRTHVPFSVSSPEPAPRLHRVPFGGTLWRPCHTFVLRPLAGPARRMRGEQRSAPSRAQVGQQHVQTCCQRSVALMSTASSGAAPGLDSDRVKAIRARPRTRRYKYCGSSKSSCPTRSETGVLSKSATRNTSSRYDV